MKKVMAWDEYLVLFSRLVEVLKHKQFAPTVVVGIARGGLVPAAMFAHYYNTRNLGVAYIQKTKTDEIFSEMLEHAVVRGFYTPMEIGDQRILLVDCIIQTGETMNAALNLVRNKAPSSIQVISICAHKNISDLDFITPMLIEADDWVVFPWENPGC